MAKVIRHTYPPHISIGLLLIIFMLSSFLSSQIFKAQWRDLMSGDQVIFGMLLVGLAVVIMTLILWEEFLFPVHIKPTEDHVIFRNHQTKLKTQILIYFLIPAIFVFAYLSYPVNPFRFFLWAAICIIAPVVGKLMSGIKNYNDFLKLTNDKIQYKNNEEEGTFNINEIKAIKLVKDDHEVLHKVQVIMNGNHEATIDLDEMELEDYYMTIEKFIVGHYKNLLS